MEELFCVFLPVVAFLFGLMIAYPKADVLGPESVQVVATKCDKNQGLEKFSANHAKVTCKDGAVFELKNLNKE